MKRIQLVGLCLVAALAFGALATASAASAAEFGQCRSLNKGTTPKAKHGAYSDGTCEKLFEKKPGKGPSAKGPNEWYPGEPQSCISMKKGEYTDPGCSAKSAKAKKGTFEKQGCFPECQKLTTGGGEAHLENEGKTVRVKCATNGSEGAEIKGAHESVGRAVYTGCHVEILGAATCNSTGAKPEEIKTEKLVADPQVIGGKVYVHYTSNITLEGKEHVLAFFECGTVGKFRVTGFADGLVSGGVEVMSNVQKQSFSATIGHQELITEINSGSGFVSFGKSFQEQETTFTGNLGAEAEIRV